MAIVGTIAAVASAYTAISSANEQRRVQQQQLAEQRKANEQAQARATAEQQRTEQEYNRANRQKCRCYQCIRCQ